MSKLSHAQLESKTKMHWRDRLRSRAFWLKQLRDLILIAATFYGVSAYLQQDMVTGQAPALSGITIDGNHLSLTTQHTVASNSSTSTTPTLVYFWGTWCPACRVTSPMIERIGVTHRVISVAVASGTDSSIQAFMDERQYHFPVLNDNTGELSALWGAMAFPAIYIIDTEGDIRYITSGVTSTFGMKLRLWLAQF
ncbi:MAG: protein disulfide oxidoreductase [Shewanella sp.]